MAPEYTAKKTILVIIKGEFQHPDIEIVQGSFMDLGTVASALRDCYEAFVNTDGFTVGEVAEMWAGMRIFELAKHAGIRHYVWSSLEYGLKRGSWDPKYHCDHLDGKGRVAEFLKAFPSDEDGLTWSVLTSGPYLQMLSEGIFVPQIKDDGTRVFSAPLGKGHIPIINLDDLGFFARYIFDHKSFVASKNLEVATAMLGWDELVETFVRVTGLPAIYADVPYSKWIESIPIAQGPVAREVPNGPTFAEDFEKFWNVWRDDVVTRDMDWIRSIHRGLSTVEDWMRETGYDGTRQRLLKNVEDREK